VLKIRVLPYFFDYDCQHLQQHFWLLLRSALKLSKMPERLRIAGAPTDTLPATASTRPADNEDDSCKRQPTQQAASERLRNDAKVELRQ
jgi:hypothetical protein